MKPLSVVKCQWGIYGDIPKDEESLIDNYNAYNALMETLDMSGVLSNNFVSKVYSYANHALSLRYVLLRDKSKAEETRKQMSEVLLKFQSLFNTYCIFSLEFKTTCNGLFLTILK